MRSTLTTHPSPVSIGQHVLLEIAALKTQRPHMPAGEFWQQYKILRACFYASPEWVKLSKSARERQPYCSMGRHHKSILHAHHKIPLFTDPMRGLDPTNVMIICKRCHKKVHNGH